MTHRLRPWHPEDAQELFEATADPEIARQLPPFDTEADARAYIAKTAGSDDVVAYVISDDTEVVLGGVMAQLNRPMRTAWVSSPLTTATPLCQNPTCEARTVGWAMPTAVDSSMVR